MHTIGLTVAINVLFAAALLRAGMPAQVSKSGGHRAMIAIPQSIQAEHKAIHEALTEATKAQGRVGACPPRGHAPQCLVTHPPQHATCCETRSTEEEAKCPG